MFRILLLVIFIRPFQGSLGQMCFEDPKQFAAYCKSTFNGFTNGGRCFFLARNAAKTYTTSTWANAFNLCANQGGDANFAQVYTSNEISALSKYASPLIGNVWVWIGFKTPLTGRLFDPLRTHPYTSATRADTRVNANNTFLKLHQNEDPNLDGECILMHTSQTEFGDVSCSNSLNVLCWVFNGIQSFKFVSKKCMKSDSAADSMTLSTVDECANQCAYEFWCRSFNWHDLTKVCELFAWHVASESASIVTQRADCYLYTYIP